jgi:hypothetical protein
VNRIVAPDGFERSCVAFEKPQPPRPNVVTTIAVRYWQRVSIQGP